MNHLAIDLGGRKSFVCLRGDDGQIIREGTVDTDKLESVLKGQARSRVVVETCAEGFGVADLATAHGHEVRVVPSTLVRALGVGARGIKTDQRDARALSEASCRMDLPSVHVPSEHARELKAMLGMRSGIVNSRTQLLNGVRGYFRARRIRPRRGGTETFPKRARELTHLPDFVELQLVAIEALTAQIRAADKNLAARAKASDVCRRLMTVPGVGVIVSLAFVAALDDPHRFDGAHAVQSYLGLVPGENSSSDKLRKTGITKAGNPFARWVLVQAAHQARRSRPNDPMVLWSYAVELRRKRQPAVIALARKMVGILWALWVKGQVYDPSRGAELSA
jgi:transposase